MKTKLVHPKEQAYLVVCGVISVIVYAVLVLVFPLGLLYVGGFALVSLLLLGWSIGQIRGNGVRVTETQLPEVYRLAADAAEQLRMKRLPAIFVVQEGGALNAFATRFVRREFVVLYSDMVELAYQDGEEELAFVIAHELAHVKRRHPMWHWLLAPALWIPFLGHAYSRACELTCDRIAASLRPGGVRGLLVLAGGKRLYGRLDARTFADQTSTETGFWVWFTEVLSSHPRLPRRVRELEAFGVRPELAGQAA